MLAFFLGLIGMHNFYAGYSARGTLQLLITILLGWIGIGLAINVVWVLCEIVSVKADAQGVLLK